MPGLSGPSLSKEVFVHKKENTTSIKLENPVEDSLIHDQMISNVKFDRLIRIEIKWNKVSGKQAQLEILKISNIPRKEKNLRVMKF